MTKNFKAEKVQPEGKAGSFHSEKNHPNCKDVRAAKRRNRDRKKKKMKPLKGKDKKTNPSQRVHRP